MIAIFATMNQVFENKDFFVKDKLFKGIWHLAPRQCFGFGSTLNMSTAINMNKTPVFRGIFSESRRALKIEKISKDV